jgi:clan AA aspartic protease (TIGR02281 family)
VSSTLVEANISSVIVSGIISQEGGPIWLGAVFMFIAYKLIFSSKKSMKNEQNLKQITVPVNQNAVKEIKIPNVQKSIFFSKKYLIFIGLSIGAITILLAYGKYNNKTKSNSVQQSDTNFIRLDTKSFLEETISKKDYTILELEKEISSNSYDHSLLLNKSLRFKMFLDAQNYTVKLYSKNCPSIAKQIGLENISFQNEYSDGIENSKYLYEVAVKKEPNIANQIIEIFETQKTNINGLLGFSSAECNQTLSTLHLRKQGIFDNDKLGNNNLSFNYLTNPVDELFDNHYQEFSSFSNAPNEDFFLTTKLPKSWNIKEKKDYTNASTVAVIEPYEKYLNGIITFSFYKKFVPEGMDESEYTDNDIAEVFYEDDELLKPIIFSLNKELKENDKIKTTLFQVGGKNHILYMTESEIPNGLVPNQKIKSLNSISFHNGKLIKMSYSGLVSKNEFSSFPYYSKVFLKVLNSVKYRKLSENTIYLTNEQNMKFLTASINGSDYKFLLDTGASSVVINKMVLSQLIENGYLTRNNYVGKSIAEIADGSIVECEDWKIPEIKIGNNIIKDITVSVINSEDSMLLFGMDGLNKLNVKKLNLF